MNFGDILSQWEKNPQNIPLVDKDAAAAKVKDAQATSQQNLKALRPEASIDLHGLIRDEAWAALDTFVSICCRQKLRKILIVHGKGNHPGSEATLAKMVRLFIECDKRLGASGHPDARQGGSGATWAAIKQVR
jgi:DNA-nicking Smr family endonuclease